MRCVTTSKLPEWIFLHLETLEGCYGHPNNENIISEVENTSTQMESMCLSQHGKIFYVILNKIQDVCTVGWVRPWVVDLKANLLKKIQMDNWEGTSAYPIYNGRIFFSDQEPAEETEVARTFLTSKWWKRKKGKIETSPVLVASEFCSFIRVR